MTNQEIINRYTVPSTPAYTDWSLLCKNETLSEDFIREFADRVDWAYISYYQTLSEDFIREFADRVNWNGISRCQTLSDEFRKEFKDKLSFPYGGFQIVFPVFTNSRYNRYGIRPIRLQN